jgi:nucleotide-binding universal stress UspA family protein
MFKRILVPLDGSTRAERAITVAAHIAHSTGGSVVLVQAVTIPFAYGPYIGTTSSAAETMDAGLDDTNKYLDSLASSELLENIETDTKALYGSAAPTVISTAQAYNADLIVMTSRGNTGMKRWILGSVAQKIARHSPTPVLVLHEGGPLPVVRHRDVRPFRVLVPLDGSALAKIALEPAALLVAALAAPYQGGLHLMRVVKSPTPEELRAAKDQESLERLKENKLHKAKTYLNSIAGHLREGPLAALNLSITWSVAVDDDIAHAIICMAENGEDAEGAGVFGRCDLIAITTHGRGGLQHWVLGSITERVLGATKFPILIVRPESTEFHRPFNGGETGEAEIQVKSTLY